jgi:hypothetical protein
LTEIIWSGAWTVTKKEEQILIAIRAIPANLIAECRMQNAEFGMEVLNLLFRNPHSEIRILNDEDHS